MDLWVRIAGIVAAGFPSAAEGYEDEPLNLHDWLVQHPAATFLYRVRGQALFAEGIRDGSLLIVDRSVTAVPGRLVVAEEDGQFVVGRYRGGAGQVVCGVVVASVTRH